MSLYVHMAVRRFLDCHLSRKAAESVLVKCSFDRYLDARTCSHPYKCLTFQNEKYQQIYYQKLQIKIRSYEVSIRNDRE